MDCITKKKKKMYDVCNTCIFLFCFLKTLNKDTTLTDDQLCCLYSYNFSPAHEQQQYLTSTKLFFLKCNKIVFEEKV